MGAVALSIVLLSTVLNNNYSLRPPKRADVRARLERSLEVSTAWLSGHPEILGNPPLMFMVADMERLSGDRRLRALLDAYRQSAYVTGPGTLGPVWARMVDQRRVSRGSMPHAYRRATPRNFFWDAHAIAPDRVLISRAQRANTFSPSRYSWGARQHQLLALDMYRYYNGASPELDATIDHLAELVARDERYDARVNDSYPQRIAFVLAASRPDLIRPRWVDRLLDSQRADGSWGYCWYGWCKGLFEFRLHDVDQLHTTIQAAWALAMLKYRFPRWIDEHYE